VLPDDDVELLPKVRDPDPNPNPNPDQVLEMWGYNLAARNMGIRHTVMKNLQVEPQGTGTDDMENNYIYHYTFGQV